jgi:hypothetical protein
VVHCRRPGDLREALEEKVRSYHPRPRSLGIGALVEVDYWIHTRLHAGVLVALLDDIADGAYVVADLRTEDYRRVRELCDRYADADIGFVDAAVLALVERLNEPKLTTLDRRHFGLLRPRQAALAKRAAGARSTRRASTARAWSTGPTSPAPTAAPPARTASGVPPRCVLFLRPASLPGRGPCRAPDRPQ